ncbi:murein L,D-transpeptidase [Desulfobacteraceae bacterium SEEP-SAG9]|nr:murein L,D-transpeptidase [Desulfobacteraceae bacterium SEEP-SAG9]
MFARNRVYSFFIYIVICMAVFWPTASLAVAAEDFQAAFIEQLELRPAKHLGIEQHGWDADRIDEILSRLYHENGLQPLWIANNGPGERANEIFNALKSSDAHGLNPERYLIDKAEKYWDSKDAVGLVRLDILLSLGLRGYVADMMEGRIEPRKVDPKLFASARDVEIDIQAIRERVLSTTDMSTFLNELIPPFHQYPKLQKALKKYRQIRAKGGWEPIPVGKVLKPYMEDERVSLIRKRLAITADLKSLDLEGSLYDNDVVEAVKNFQSRHALEIDGVIGKNTLSAMNVPVEKRIRQIIINMERYRWLKRQVEGRMIVVNIAGFRAAGVNPIKGELEIVMPVIVGKEYHKTPVFGNMIKYVEFNPYWNIPPSIARNEMLPKLKKNRFYLKERNIRVFESWNPGAKELDSTAIGWQHVGRRDIGRFKLRQDPGPKNALGTVKFVFPNRFNVYLHDTPSHGLFSERKRTFSHGCIRVSRPAELASYILGGEEGGWGLARVKEIIKTGKRKIVRLKSPLPIYILYRTVIVDPENNEIIFRSDVYGRDALLEKALF